MTRGHAVRPAHDQVVDEYLRVMLGGPWDAAVNPAGGGPALEVMLFQVQGLRLAIPAAHLMRAADWPAVLLPPLTPHPWVRGRFGAGREMTTLVDSAQLLIPPRYRRPHPERGARIIVLRGGAWALTCDAGVETMTLPADRVQWRTPYTTRPWLAGTLRSHECGLLDVEALIGVVRAELGSERGLAWDMLKERGD